MNLETFTPHPKEKTEDVILKIVDVAFWMFDYRYNVPKDLLEYQGSEFCEWIPIDKQFLRCIQLLLETKKHRYTLYELEWYLKNETSYHYDDSIEGPYY